MSFNGILSQKNAACSVICLGTKIVIILHGGIYWTFLSSSSTTEYTRL